MSSSSPISSGGIHLDLHHLRNISIDLLDRIDRLKDMSGNLISIPSMGSMSRVWKRSTSSSTVQELVGHDRSIDARSIVTIIVFFIVNILVIWPIRIPLPLFVTRLINWVIPPQQSERDQPHDTATRDPRRLHFTLGLETAPVIGVLLLLASTCIPGSVITDGIVGSEGVRPYDIMTLFLSFAYISISLDCTGVLQYLAHLVGTKSGSSGSFLYFAFYCFFSLTGLIIGNDPLILSGTPFLVYFTRHAAITPHDQTSFLFTHFQASNLVSALLVSSNPTNLVLTSAFGISFLQYSAWLALPTIAGMVVLYPIVRYGVFRNRIPKTLNPPKVNPKDSLIDPWGGIFGTVLFIVVIILLVSLSAVGLLEGVQGVWSITAPAGIIMFIRDCWHDLIVRKRRQSGVIGEGHQDGDRDGDREGRRKQGMVGVEKDREMTEIGKISTEGGGERGSEMADTGVSSVNNHKRPRSRSADISAREESPSTSHSAARHGNTPTPTFSPTPSPEPIDPSDTAHSKSDQIPSSPPNHPPTPPTPKVRTSPLLAPVRLFTYLFPTPALIITRLPLQLIPFAFSMFILVEALSYTGWIRVFAGWWAAWVDVGGVGGAIWLMGMISVLGCNAFGTNIGATVLLSRILQNWRATEGQVSDRTLYGAVFTLAVGSNFGAYSFVFSASLAGLLWRNILNQKGLSISAREFIKWNTIPVMVTMLVGCLVVAGEVCVMFDS